MLIKTNKTKELVESKLGIDFEEFKLVGCREISALTLILNILYCLLFVLHTIHYSVHILMLA